MRLDAAEAQLFRLKLTTISSNAAIRFSILIKIPQKHSKTDFTAILLRKSFANDVFCGICFGSRIATQKVPIAAMEFVAFGVA
jgi:hypothetical protein